MKPNNVIVSLTNLKLLVALGAVIQVASYSILTSHSYAQTSDQFADQFTRIGDNSNNNVVVPNNNQNNNQPQNNNQSSSQNSNSINFPRYPLQYPLVAPVNTENDWGFNFSLGVNTLDASNVTAYFGIIFQPGRTESSAARMSKILKEVEVLEANKKIAESQLSLLLTQIEEARVRVDRMKSENK